MSYNANDIITSYYNAIKSITDCKVYTVAPNEAENTFIIIDVKLSENNISKDGNVFAMQVNISVIDKTNSRNNSKKKINDISKQVIDLFLANTTVTGYESCLRTFDNENEVEQIINEGRLIEKSLIFTDILQYVAI